LGWKQLHGGGLNQSERQSILASAARPEEDVAAGLASTTGHHFANDPQWAMEVLSRLKPNGERSGYEIVQALGLLAEKHGSVLDSKKVTRCLENLGELCASEHPSGERNLDKVARAFPKQVYAHVRKLHKIAAAGPVEEEHRWRLARSLSLGPIGDDEYVDSEIHALWQEAASAQCEDGGRHFRLALLQSLIWADATSAPDRIRKLVAACKSGEDLKLATDLVAVPGSRFVFNFPDIVRSLLARGDDFAVAGLIRESLLGSACGGGRSYSDHELDPEYRYILEQGEALANRYRDDALLGKFYRHIAEYERRDSERTKRAFRDMDEPD
jgi:hypothetical protein